jgi:predicted transglutaminase-like cysteine proteinase
MIRCIAFSVLAILSCTSFSGGAEARSRSVQDPQAPIVDGAPTLAPFQHVRFCLHNPAECQSNPAENDHIDLSAETSELLNRVNRDVNASIIPTVKSYGSNLADAWRIAPDMGDCNDYAVTKRHELMQSGLPSAALRLSVVKTTAGIGHLVLVVVTTKGDIVLDNLTDEIRSWRNTDYQWLKIQSASNAKFWYAIQAPSVGVAMSRAERRIRLADRRIHLAYR